MRLQRVQASRKERATSWKEPKVCKGVCVVCYCGCAQPSNVVFPVWLCLSFHHCRRRPATVAVVGCVPLPMPSSSRRPLSAIFLGTQLSTPDSAAKSTASGLPSPPATNSTGSGSAGDTGSIRQRPKTVMSNENKPTNTSTASDDDDENDIPNDEDNTARLNVSTPANDSHMGALQRVKSLAQRNRMVRLAGLLSLRLTHALVYSVVATVARPSTNSLLSLD